MIFHRNETTVICAVNYSRGYSIACDSGQFSYIRIFVLLFLARSLCIARSPCLSYVRDACANGSILRTREIAPRLVILGSFSKRAIWYIKSAAEAASSVSITNATSASVLSSLHLSVDCNGLNRLRDRKVW